MRWKPILTVIATAVFVVVGSNLAFAQHSSTNYKIEESFIGSGGQLDSSSASFQARASLGDLGIGYGESNAFALWAGYTTDRTEFIEFSVNTSSVDVGVVSTSAAEMGTATFSVRTYLAQGYAVTTYSPGPRNNNVTWDNLTAPTASSPGTEQFGINLVANTLPEVIGADPVQVPDASFSFGDAATGYDTANLYKYVDGDIIAESSSSTGQTDYTISYLFNISDVTAGGAYVMNHALIATSTF